jgi:predicted HAD superfamily phosphohydrolase YqeG
MSIESSGEADREGVNMAKLRHGVNVILHPELVHVDALLDKFEDFDVEALRALTGKRIESVLIDVDGCIAQPYGAILKENLDSIDRLRQHIGVAVYSNCKALHRLTPLREREIKIYDGHIAKPSAEGFIDACRRARFDVNGTWMIGDSPYTDGGAGVKGVLEGMCLVKPIGGVGTEASFMQKHKLPVANFLREVAMGSILSGNQVLYSYDLRRWRES